MLVSYKQYTVASGKASTDSQLYMHRCLPILCSVSVWDKRWGYVPHSSDLGLWTHHFGLFSLFDLVFSVLVHLCPCLNPVSLPLVISLTSRSLSCSSFHLTLKVEANTWKDWWPFNENVSISVVEGVGLLCVSETRHSLHVTRAFTNCVFYISFSSPLCLVLSFFLYLTSGQGFLYLVNTINIQIFSFMKWISSSPVRSSNRRDHPPLSIQSLSTDNWNKIRPRWSIYMFQISPRCFALESGQLQRKRQNRQT